MQNDQLSRSRWTSTQIENLITLYNDGLSANQIFDQHNRLVGNRTLGAIQNQIFVLKIDGKISKDGNERSDGWSDEELSELKRLIEGGVSAKKIYQEYKHLFKERSYGAISSRVSSMKKEMGLSQSKNKSLQVEQQDSSATQCSSFDDKEITFKQWKAIKTINYKLGIEFTGKTRRDACEFIKKYKDESYAIDKQESACHEVPEVPAHRDTVTNELIDAVRENTETMSKGFDAMVRGIAEIKTLLVEIDSNSRDIVKTDKDIQEKMQTIQKFGVTVKGMK